MTAVDVTADDIAWVAGVHDTAFGDFPLILRFDGEGWERTPAPETRVTFIDDIELWSPEEGWAVGHHQLGNDLRTLTLHWDGDEWTVVESPGFNFTLSSVSIGRPDDAWAVGFDGVGPPIHWDGERWSPSVVKDDERHLEPLDVEVTSTGEAWIVGYSEDPDPGAAVILSWDGSEWMYVAVRDRRGFDSLTAIDSANEAWAGGYQRTRDATTPIALRKSDGTWKPHRLPVVGRGGNFNDLVVTGDGTAWATGRASSRKLGLFGILEAACLHRAP